MGFLSNAHFWNWFWGIWALVTLPPFLAAEIFTLLTNPFFTLSWHVWNLEGGFIPGESWTTWTAGHVLVSGFLIVLLLWLIGHLCFGLWR